MRKPPLNKNQTFNLEIQSRGRKTGEHLEALGCWADCPADRDDLSVLGGVEQHTLTRVRCEKVPLNVRMIGKDGDGPVIAEMGPHLRWE